MNSTNTPVPEGKMVREILKKTEISRIIVLQVREKNSKRSKLPYYPGRKYGRIHESDKYSRTGR